jgi:oligopeptidase A
MSDTKPTDNPLLDPPTRIPFDRIEAAHVEPAIDTLLARARAAVRSIADAPGARTYAATLGALDDATERLEVAMGIVDHLESLSGDPALRAAYNAAQPKVSAFYAELPLDEGLWRAVQAFAATAEAAALDPTRARFLQKTVDDFRRHGADLPAAQKARVKAIDVELSEVTTRFAQNVVDEIDNWQLIIDDEARLAGLPPSAVEAARASAEGAGVDGWRFTLHAPSMMPVLQHLEDASIREAVYRAYNTRATGGERDNRPLIARILTLRAEKAKLLGYAHIGDLLLERRMAKDAATARRFVEALETHTRPFFEAEHADLEAFRRQLEDDDAPPIAAWDLGFYAEKLRRARFDFDEEALRPYFAAEKVLDGMFALVNRLYGVDVHPITDWPTWHDDVRVYAVDDADGARIGVFYADLFPRAGKRGGAWMRPLITTLPGEGPQVGVMCANVTPPLGDKPALMTHREVETFFHEFGHLLHHLLTRVEVRGLAGTNVAWDFVELPSQIMENWCWEKASLDLFARHWQTGETIPDALFDRLLRTRTYRAAAHQMRQLGFATADLALHCDYDPARDGDVLPWARTIMQRFSPVPLPDDYGMIAGFTHLFANPVGYAAGYYSYKWAEVLDADAFTRFRDEGLFSREVGMAFRQHILERGDSRDPAELYEAFMGRGPDQAALLERAGLVG